MTDPSGRRILALPSVHPCEYISPSTLLQSLISICHDIDGYRSEPFPIHRGIAREAVRESGLLLAFFEDIRNSCSEVPESAILGLSEIHVALQKTRHLLQDCARRGARLWMLMMSDRVAGELRLLVRSIGVALDVVPLGSIDVSSEVGELVQLVTRQAWGAKIQIDPADRLAIEEVRLILRKFENRVDPSPEVLKRVLDHLGIRSWSQCNEELLFLEEEFLAIDDSDGGEATLLSSLVGFMAYCRATMLGMVDGKRSGKKEHKGQDIIIARLNSEHFRCPISLELMADPVTISTGHTYDRASIERWFKSGHHTCPVTREKLTNTELVPNSTLRKLVANYCNVPDTTTNRCRKRNIVKNLSPSSSSAAGSIGLLASFLVDSLSTGTTENKAKAAYEIRLLSKSSQFNRASLVEAGSIPWLLHLLYSFDPSTQENSITALLNLSKHPKGRTAIHEAGGLSLIVDVVGEGLKVESRQNAAAILFYLSSVEEYRREIGDIPEAIPALVEMLRGESYRGKKNAVVTLFGLILLPENHPKVVAADAISALSNHLLTERDDLLVDCLAVLAKLAERQEGTNAILGSSAVPLLVGILGSSSTSPSGREYCVSVLLSLCNNGGEKVVSSLEKMPMLMPSLYSLLTDGSPHAGKKARSLLNHIHRFHDQRCPMMLASQVQDRIIRAQ